MGAEERISLSPCDPWRSLGKQEGRGYVLVGEGSLWGGEKELMKFQDVPRSASSRLV